MHENKVPLKLWDHSLELQGLTRSHTALDNPALDGQVPEAKLTGREADISEIAEFDFYDWVKFFDLDIAYPDDRECYGRWLGPAHDVGPHLTAKILKKNGQVIYSGTYRALNSNEIASETERQLRLAFDEEITTRIGGPMTIEQLRQHDAQAETPMYDPFDLDGRLPDIDDATPEYRDQYIGAELRLPVQGTMTSGTVKQRSRTPGGDLFGKQNDNPILDTRSYDVEFEDGTIRGYTAKVIAENMISQCDPLGRIDIVRRFKSRDCLNVDEILEVHLEDPSGITIELSMNETSISLTILLGDRLVTEVAKTFLGEDLQEKFWGNLHILIRRVDDLLTLNGRNGHEVGVATTTRTMANETLHVLHLLRLRLLRRSASCRSKGACDHP